MQALAHALTRTPLKRLYQYWIGSLHARQSRTTRVCVYGFACKTRLLFHEEYQCILYSVFFSSFLPIYLMFPLTSLAKLLLPLSSKSGRSLIFLQARALEPFQFNLKSILFYSYYNFTLIRN